MLSYASHASMAKVANGGFKARFLARHDSQSALRAPNANPGNASSPVRHICRPEPLPALYSIDFPPPLLCLCPLHLAPPAIVFPPDLSFPYRLYKFRDIFWSDPPIHVSLPFSLSISRVDEAVPGVLVAA